MPIDWNIQDDPFGTQLPSRVLEEIVVRQRDDRVVAAVLARARRSDPVRPPRVVAVVRAAGCRLVRTGADGALVACGREDGEPDAVERRVHEAEERPHAVLRVLEVGAARVGRAAAGLAHRAGPVEHEHDVERLRRARRARGRGRLHLETLDPEDPREEEADVGRRVHLDGVVVAERRVASRRRLHAAHRDRRRDVVAELDLVLLAGRRPVVLRGRGRVRRIRKVLRAGQRGRVHTRLQLTLHQIGLADVDHERDHDEHRRHGQCSQHDYLSRFVPDCCPIAAIAVHACLHRST